MTGERYPGLISIVLATYNWPEALNLCLQSLAGQTDRGFEIVIVDDGSRPDTAALVDSFKAGFPVPVTHLWQEDIGFRKTLILNKGIEAARGGYLVFLDGDCIVQPDFVARHRALAVPGHMVTGSRVMLGQKLTAAMCAGGIWHYRAFRRNVLRYRLTGQSSKLVSLFVKLPDSSYRNYRRFVWRRIKGCNMACWRADAVAVGGFDETITGWGHEDADFVLRLQDRGVVRKSGAFATEVLHLWHRISDRSAEPRNARMLRERMRRSAPPA